MAEKNKTVVTKTTTDTTVTTVTTTTRTSDGEGGWGNLSALTRAIIIIGSVALLCLAIGIIFFGRAHIISNGMESTYAKGSKVFFSRYATPDVSDVVLFHHPESDTIVPSAPDKNYYKMCRLYGNSWCNRSELRPLKMKRRPVYASRVVALPGDVVAIKDGLICTAQGNSLVRVADPATARNVYVVGTNAYLMPSTLDSLGLSSDAISCDEINPEEILSFYRHRTPQGSFLAVYALSQKQVENLRTNNMVTLLEMVKLPQEHFDPIVFPFQEKRHFNFTYMTPMVVPAKDKVVKLDVNNLPFYKRCIEAYEGNRVEVDNGNIYINGKAATSYRFKQNYYFVVNDNRATTDDSRFFGFLPEKHIKGVVK